jgi:hypothetical protein
LPRIREAFNEIGRTPPEPKGTIDTLPLLTQRFGRRAGDMKVCKLVLTSECARARHDLFKFAKHMNNKFS